LNDWLAWVDQISGNRTQALAVAPSARPPGRASLAQVWTLA